MASTPKRKQKAKPPRGKAKTPKVIKPHSIKIDDDDMNWLLWGKLLLYWINNPGQRPRTAKDLQDALDYHQPRIYGKVRGNATTPVEFRTYDGTGPIIIPIPTMDMIKNDWDHLQDRVDNGNMKYPVPKFYNKMFQGTPPRRNFADYQELEDMAVRRLGEYVINECM